MGYNNADVRKYIALTLTTPLLIIATFYFIFTLINPELSINYVPKFVNDVSNYLGIDLLILISKFGIIGALFILGFLKIIETKNLGLKNF